MKEQRTNTYLEEMQKFINKQCIVTTVTDNKIEGICKAIDFNHLNIVLMTNKEKIIIKNVKTISRQRDYIEAK